MKKYLFKLNRSVSCRFGGFTNEAAAVGNTPWAAFDKVRKAALPKSKKLRAIAEKNHPLEVMSSKVLLDFDDMKVGSVIDFVDVDGVAMYGYTVVSIKNGEVVALSDNVDGDKAIVPMERIFNIG